MGVEGNPSVVRDWWLEEVKHGGRRARGWGPFDFGDDQVSVGWLEGLGVVRAI